MTAAIDGSNYLQCRSFEVATAAASTAEATLVRGSYEICCTNDCYIRFGKTGMSAAIALTGSQPAAGAASAHTIRLYALQRQVLDIPADGIYFRVIRASADGVLTFNGPIALAPNA